MRLIRMSLTLVTFVVVPFMLLACSGGKNPVQPGENGDLIIPSVAV